MDKVSRTTKHLNQHHQSPGTGDAVQKCLAWEFFRSRMSRSPSVTNAHALNLEGRLHAPVEKLHRKTHKLNMLRSGGVLVEDR